jgi:hypothetical protein
VSPDWLRVSGHKVRLSHAAFVTICFHTNGTRMKVNSTNRHIHGNSFQNVIDISQHPSLCLGPIVSFICPKF